MNISPRIWPFLLIVPVIAACSELQTYRSDGLAPVVTRGHGANYWLTELSTTRGKTPDEIRVTVAAWEQEFHNNPDTGNRIKLALLLTAGDASARDPERARELLDEISEAPSNASDRELLNLLRQIIHERDEAGDSITRLKKQMRQQSRRIRELEQQQRALTDIEQNIQQRDVQPPLQNGDQ